MDKFEAYYNDISCGIKPLIQCVTAALSGTHDGGKAAVETLMVALNHWDEADQRLKEAPHA